MYSIDSIYYVYSIYIQYISYSGEKKPLFLKNIPK